MLVHLATAMLAAFVGAYVAVSLRQSVVVGFLLAGIVIGPFTPGFMGDVHAVEALAEIGIVFLMFVIGVQLSFRELLRAGRVALVGASLQVLVTRALGYGLGRLVGFGGLESLYFGAVVSNSSSTVLGKVFAERDQADSGPARTALAWSSVQDLGTVVLVAVLSAASVAERGDTSPVTTIGRTALFLGLMLPVAIFALPRLLARVASLRNREVFVLVSGCIALGISYLSGLLGVSTALGAFLAGAIVGDSDLSHRILGETMPLRDLFSGLFFVSIGMLIDPRFLLEHPGLVLFAAVSIVVLKGLIATAVPRLLGGSWGAAAVVGLGLAQCGEFSLLMARLGTELGAISSLAFNTMLSGTVLSILIAPRLAGAAVPIGRWLARGLEEPELEARDGRLEPLRGHVVVCGHGRVGSVVTSLLREQGVPFVVVDEDPVVVAELRRGGVSAIVGDASRAVVLERARLANAAAVVVALPEKIAARQILEHARHANPRAKVVARTHSHDERDALMAMGIDEAVIGEFELALELGRRALLSAGVTHAEVERGVDEKRRHGR